MSHLDRHLRWRVVGDLRSFDQKVSAVGAVGYLWSFAQKVSAVRVVGDLWSLVQDSSVVRVVGYLGPLAQVTEYVAVTFSCEIRGRVSAVDHRLLVTCDRLCKISLLSGLLDTCGRLLRPWITPSSGMASLRSGFLATWMFGLVFCGRLRRPPSLVSRWEEERLYLTA